MPVVKIVGLPSGEQTVEVERIWSEETWPKDTEPTCHLNLTRAQLHLSRDDRAALERNTTPPLTIDELIEGVTVNRWEGCALRQIVAPGDGSVHLSIVALRRLNGEEAAAQTGA